MDDSRRNGKIYNTKSTLKSSGVLIAAGLIYFFCYNLFELHFTLLDSFTFAFVQLALMIPTILGLILAYKLWTAIIVVVIAVLVWTATRLKRTHWPINK